MSNASHRKTREIPAGRYLAAVALILALSAAVVLTAFLAVPTAHAASTGYLSPAVSAARASQLRPHWDGRTPVFWTAHMEPMCRQRYAGRVGMGFDTHTGAVFAMECEAEGDSGPYSWTVLGTRNGQALSWHQVKRYCHQVTCQAVPAIVRHALGIGQHVPALMHVAGTTAVYVKQGRNGVKVYLS